MTRAALIKDGVVQVGGQELIDVWQSDRVGLLWVDLQNSDALAEAATLRAFDIHPLAIQDAQRDRHPPKLEAFSEYVFILLKGLDADTQGINFGAIQLALFVGPGYLITRHAKASTSANHIWKELESGSRGLPASPGELALRLMSRLAILY